MLRKVLRFAPWITLALFLAPVLIGLLATWLPAFGYLPVIGAERFSLNYFNAVYHWPGVGKALRSTVLSAYSATLLAFLLAVLFCIVTYQTRLWRGLQFLLAPLIAVPHAAFAIGFAFLIAPSGWLARIIASSASDWQRPPDWQTLQDPHGWSLLIGLLIKETPFLILIFIGALNQIDCQRILWLARGYAYYPWQIWLKLILPQLYPKIRLPLYAVLVYSLSVVDLALVLGPTTPPTFAVLVLQWFNDPDVQMRLQAAAGATLLLCIVLASLLLWFSAERLLARLLRPWLSAGQRGSALQLAKHSARLAIFTLLALSVLSLLAILCWSFAWRWRFPDVLPSVWTLQHWFNHGAGLWQPFINSFVTALGATAISTVLVISCLENENQMARPPRALWILYVPLLVPQIGFLFGFQIALIGLRLDGHWLALCWSHMLFVLPYTYLSLALAYRRFDQRYLWVASGLCGSYWRALWRIKLLMLLRPVLIATAIGFAVSIAQYLPTLFAGAGRFNTLTTEAISLASGADRRITALYALSQTVLPMLVYALALIIPIWSFRNRKNMHV